MNVFEELVNILTDKGLTVSAAESCTGGLFASDIVSVANASKVFSASFVSYSVEAKNEILGVKLETIEEFGVVSEKVALEMAECARNKTNSDVAVGITGYAGPSNGKSDEKIGLVCFGFSVNGKTVSSVKNFGDVGRNVVRELASVYAATSLIRLIKTFGDK